LSLQTQIENKVKAAFDVAFMQLENESHMHSGPADESHFKLTLVAPEFDGLSKVKRHQAVYKALSDEMPQFHALALHTFSPAEWDARPDVADSPLCKGGSKA
jgi:BolA protein